MKSDLTSLDEFVRNFFELERYIEPNGELLTIEEIQSFTNSPHLIQSDRSAMDRLLNDPEAVEMIETSESSLNVIPFKKPSISKQRTLIPVVTDTGMKKVAASSELIDGSGKDAIQVKDEVLEGFLQIIEYKSSQFLVSGHLVLFASQGSLRLILPDGTEITDFKEEDGLLTFRAVVKEKFDLSKICYELH